MNDYDKKRVNEEGRINHECLNTGNSYEAYNDYLEKLSYQKVPGRF